MTPEEREIDQLRYEVNRLRDILLSKGYSPCNSIACNCGGYHGGYAEYTLTEITEYIKACGMWSGTILGSLRFIFGTYGINPND